MHEPDRLRQVLSAMFPLAVSSMVSWPRLTGLLFWSIALTGVLLACIPNFNGPGVPARGARAIDPRLWWIAGLPIVLSAVSVAVFQLPLRELSWWPWLMLPFIVMAARRGEIRLPSLAFGAAIGCVLAPTLLLIAAVRTDDVRVSLPMNAIVFAQAASALALVCMWCAGRVQGWHRWALATCCALGLVAAVGLGFRGLLTALPIFLFVFLKWDNPPGRSRWRGWLILLAVGAAVAGLMVWFGHRSLMFQRLALFPTEIESFEQGQVHFSSAGSRLMLWKAAIGFAIEHPMFGIGTHQFHNGLVALRAEGLFPADVDLFHHAHNSYLNLLAEYGLVGAATLGAVMVMLWRHLASLPPGPASLGRTLVVLWAVMGLTNDVLGHQHSIRIITLLLACCLAVRDPPRPGDLASGARVRA